MINPLITTLILVPARSGSKALPDKNIKLLAGKPLLAWTADSIRLASVPNSLALLSTDSKNYAELGKSLGLTVPFLRPAEYAADNSSAINVVQHALAWFQGFYNYLPQQLMYLQPTSPLRNPEAINQSLQMLLNQNADAVVACQQIYRDLTTLFRYDSGYLQAIASQQTMQTNRQQIKPLLTPNGALYLCKTEHLLNNNNFYPEKTLPLVMNKIASLDIDNEEDWAIAEAYIQQGLHL